MPAKNLYYSDDDEALIAAAERVARRQRKSLSRFAIEALEEKVARAAAEPASPTPNWSEIAAEPSNA